MQDINAIYEIELLAGDDLISPWQIDVERLPLEWNIGKLLR